nr:hypothetical protein [uncultured Roseateles sp.]
MKRLSALLLALPFAVGAQEPPSTDFKGFHVGTRIDEAKVVNDFKAKCSKTFCSGDTTIAGAKAKVYFAVGLDGLIDRINVTFSPSSFPEVAAALRAKFGPPADGNTTKVQNSYGATASQTVLLWNRPDGASIVARERADRISEADVTYVSARELQVIEFNRKNNIGDL